MAAVIGSLNIVLRYLTALGTYACIAEAGILSDLVSQLLGISSKHTALTAGHVLRALEAEGSDITDRTDCLSLVFTEEALRVILENCEVMLLRNSLDSIEIGSETVERYGNNSLGLRSDSLLDRFCGNLEGIRIYICVNGGRICLNNTECGA